MRNEKNTIYKRNAAGEEIYCVRDDGQVKNGRSLAGCVAMFKRGRGIIIIWARDPNENRGIARHVRSTVAIKVARSPRRHTPWFWVAARSVGVFFFLKREGGGGKHFMAATLPLDPVAIFSFRGGRPTAKNHELPLYCNSAVWWQKLIRRFCRFLDYRVNSKEILRFKTWQSMICLLRIYSAISEQGPKLISHYYLIIHAWWQNSMCLGNNWCNFF